MIDTKWLNKSQKEIITNGSTDEELDHHRMVCNSKIWRQSLLSIIND